MGPAADGVKSDLGQPLPQQDNGMQPPLPLMRNHTVLKRVLPEDQQALVENYTQEAVRFIQEHQSGPFFLYVPHSAVHFPIYPGQQWAGKSPHGYFSDWVEEVDNSVGQVLQTVRDLNLSDCTFVLFTSDNGGTPRSINAPLRGHKNTTWEGGVRVPTIAWWPGQIPAGSQSDAILGLFDYMPTAAALAEVPLPSDRQYDGVNIWPILVGEPTAPPAHDTFYYFRGLRLEGVRFGNWKLHFPYNQKTKQVAPTRLYNLAEDISEQHDVSTDHPEVVQQLQQLVVAMDADLGRVQLGPGCRPLGRVANPVPLLPFSD